MLRIKNLRWEFGTVLPEEIKDNLCEQEVIIYNTRYVIYLKVASFYHLLPNVRTVTTSNSKLKSLFAPKDFFCMFTKMQSLIIIIPYGAGVLNKLLWA